MSRRGGGDPVWLLPCGLFWILLTRLQRYTTLHQALKLPPMPLSDHSVQITLESFLELVNCLPSLPNSPSRLNPLHPACNCDPMGSASMQCHGNGTCQCRRGFVGHKCDKCEMNYFYDRATHQCEECPVCYGLVKKYVSICSQRSFLY